MTYITEEALLRAADVLEGLASRAAIDYSSLIETALTLRTYADLQRDMDLLDAAAGLESLATRGELPLDITGRQRAAALSRRVRAEDSV